jgi:EmrB/QacA subfamily drug resistance transporter
MPVSDTARRSHYQVTFAVLAISVSAFALLQSLVVPVLAEIQVDLHTSQTTVTWVLTAYLLSASVCTPIVGRIGDKVGKERLLVVALVALSVGSLMAALSTSIGLMIVGRVIQGVGGGVLPLSFGIIRDEFPQKKVPGAVAAVASLSAVGAGLGLVLAGPIVSAFDYHWLFWFPMIVTAAAALGAVAFVPESPVRTPGKISVLPAVLLSAWLVALLLALSQGSQWGWDSLAVIGLLAASVVLAAVWVWVENRSVSPLIDMRMMRLPAVWTTNVVALLVGFAMYASFAFLPQLSQTPSATGYGFGASVTESGLILLPSSVTMFLAGMYSARAARRIGPKAVVVAGSLIVAVAMGLVAFVHAHPWELVVANGVMGVGVGLIFACLSNLIVAAVPAEQTGVASGMNANIRTVGGSIGAAVMATIVTASVFPDGLPHESGYTRGFAMLMVVMVLCAAVALKIPSVGRRVIEEHLVGEPEHAELGMVAGGTLIGDKSE